MGAEVEVAEVEVAEVGEAVGVVAEEEAGEEVGVEHG